MKKILIAEDEDSIRELIALNLTHSGYEVIQATNGTEAIEIFTKMKNELDIVLLDIMMPGEDGLTVCRHARSLNANVGIIMLTAKTQESDKVTGLYSGADDYITKPFSVVELLARIESVYRRVRLNREIIISSNHDEIKSGSFTLSSKRRAIFISDKKVELSQIEFQILEFFFSNPGKTITRQEILEYVWGGTYFGDDKVVDVNIRRLRLKIEKDPSSPEHLITVWGQGYKWVE